MINCDVKRVIHCVLNFPQTRTTGNDFQQAADLLLQTVANCC